MTYAQKVDAIKNALILKFANLYHWYAPDKASVPYAVWYEEKQNGLRADNKLLEGTASGVIHYFTLTENDATVPQIIPALESIGACCYLNSTQFEEDTFLIHYEWVWEI